MTTNTHLASAGSHRRSTWAVLLTLLLSMGFLLSACEDDDESKVEQPEAPAVSFVYVTGSTDAAIDGFILDKETGSLTEMDGAPFGGIGSNRMMIAHPSATTLFVDQSGGGRVLIKEMDPGDGHLSGVSQGTVTIAGAGSAFVALTPDGTRFYGTDDNTLTLRGYTFDDEDRKLTQMSWSPLNTGLVPNVAAMDATGSYFYLFTSPNTIYSYALDSSTGEPSPTPGASLATSFTSAFQMVADPEGEYMIVFSSSGNTLNSLSIDANGDLVEEGSVGVGNFVNALSISPDGKYVYAACGPNGLFIYEFDRADGSFSPVPGSPYLAEFGPHYAVATADGKYLYVVQHIAPVLAGYEVLGDGSLEPLGLPGGDIATMSEFALIVDPPVAE